MFLGKPSPDGMTATVSCVARLARVTGQPHLSRRTAKAGQCRFHRNGIALVEQGGVQRVEHVAQRGKPGHVAVIPAAMHERA